jgi:hypothetical protein
MKLAAKVLRIVISQYVSGVVKIVIPGVRRATGLKATLASRTFAFPSPSDFSRAVQGLRVIFVF